MDELRMDFEQLKSARHLLDKDDYIEMIHDLRQIVASLFTYRGIGAYQYKEMQQLLLEIIQEEDKANG